LDKKQQYNFTVEKILKRNYFIWQKPSS